MKNINAQLLALHKLIANLIVNTIKINCSLMLIVSNHYGIKCLNTL